MPVPLKCFRYSIVRSIDHQKSNRTGDALCIFSGEKMLRGWGKIGERFSGLGGQAPECPNMPVAYFPPALTIYAHIPGQHLLQTRRTPHG